MRFYKLKREFEGSISLESGGGVLEPGGSAKTVVPDRKRDPLQVLVDKFNEQWAGNFTEGDRVVIDTLWRRIADNPQGRRHHPSRRQASLRIKPAAQGVRRRGA